jgi:hypothetical protein
VNLGTAAAPGRFRYDKDTHGLCRNVDGVAPRLEFLAPTAQDILPDPLASFQDDLMRRMKNLADPTAPAAASQFQHVPSVSPVEMTRPSASSDQGDDGDESDADEAGGEDDTDEFKGISDLNEYLCIFEEQMEYLSDIAPGTMIDESGAEPPPDPHNLEEIVPPADDEEVADSANAQSEQPAGLCTSGGQC